MADYILRESMIVSGIVASAFAAFSALVGAAAVSAIVLTLALSLIVLGWVGW